MVSNYDVNINLKYRADLTELKQAEAEADRVMTKMDRVITFVRTNTSKIARSIQSVMSIMTNVLRTAGIMLNPVQEAIVGSISVVLASIVQMQSILAAGTGGLSLVLGITMVSTAIGLSITGIYAATQQMDEIRSRLSAAESAARSMVGIYNIWS